MSWETSPFFFKIGEFVFLLLLDSETGTVQHCANPMLLRLQQQNRSVCDGRELTHIAVMSREPVTQCEACLAALKGLPNV